MGLKGTDGADILERARELGAEPVAKERALTALGSSGDLNGVHFLTASGDMGETVLKQLDLEYEVVHDCSEPPQPSDTRGVVGALQRRRVALILFVGGDGTARDVLSALEDRIPVIGVPSGVKMHSGVFANSPSAAGALLHKFIEQDLSTARVEVMDIDEEAFREGRLSAGLYGYLDTPYKPGLVQSSKSVYSGEGVETEKKEIAEYFVERMGDDVTYILGPGTTVGAIAETLGVEGTLLGVDVVLNRRIVSRDASESDILGAVGEEARIVVTPIGAQGFILGRGNQQISPRVVGEVGEDNIDVVATPTKLRSTPVIRVDTGDPELDEVLRGYIRVLTGFRRYRMVKVE